MDKRVLIGAAAVGVIGYLVWSMRSSAQQQVNTTAANTSGSASAVLSGLLSGWANPSSVIPSAGTVANNGTVATPAPAPAPTAWRPATMEDNTPAPAPAPAPAPRPATGFAGVQNMAARPWNGPTTPSTSNIGANRDTAASRAARAANVAAIRTKMRGAGADAWVSGEA